MQLPAKALYSDLGTEKQCVCQNLKLLLLPEHVSLPVARYTMHSLEEEMVHWAPTCSPWPACSSAETSQ